MDQRIEYCLSNVDAGDRSSLCGLAECADVEEYPCLGRCGECYESTILVVDGGLRRAPCLDDLLADIEVASNPEGEQG